MVKRLAILGSTGSIGRQALEVVDALPESFSVETLTANNNTDMLVAQAKKYLPNIVVIGNKQKYETVSEALKRLPIKIYAGAEAIAQVAAMSNIDMVLSALVGFSGLQPAISALEAGTPVALANKESLVVAGDLMNATAISKRVPIIPVDSEHSAIFQCLQGEHKNGVEKIILTASGGPFRGRDAVFLETVTPAQALKHPNWDMGSKVTIDSASMMNKGLEAIEAKWLFNLKPSQIEVIIHPQSIIHSMVQFTDGSMKAQMSLPDMRLPIQYAMTYPQRKQTDFPRLNFTHYSSLTFEQVNRSVFHNLSLAFAAMERGGNAPCILNAANEIAVEAFLKERISFTGMSSVIEKTLEKVSFITMPAFNDYLESDREARKVASEVIGR
ncbi:MAG: 1-deoxy-D-xylulose-5-phosphate reductoisomerase [Cytophagaceae bacterium]|jgi:1-deoxy-D-xylulose-5-phosphate reductoisomerase|nr:1-deoxy-D-xylulose-5-phosphate reductoisomerase [Cytophagaceae bacterium]